MNKHAILLMVSGIFCIPVFCAEKPALEHNLSTRATDVDVSVLSKRKRSALQQPFAPALREDVDDALLEAQRSASVCHRERRASMFAPGGGAYAAPKTILQALAVSASTCAVARASYEHTGGGSGGRYYRGNEDLACARTSVTVGAPTRSGKPVLAHTECVEGEEVLKGRGHDERNIRRRVGGLLDDVEAFALPPTVHSLAMAARDRAEADVLTGLAAIKVVNEEGGVHAGAGLLHEATKTGDAAGALHTEYAVGGVVRAAAVDDVRPGISLSEVGEHLRAGNGSPKKMQAAHVEALDGIRPDALGILVRQIRDKRVLN